ncbi:hypothetical protein Sjap_016728 [Stephania japonica]|uniref:Kinesin motor domain-containing protein n=1 Tax=Stephania japonica TaxID=461633 RepID=A0AAP0IN82_9MAGN
MHVWSSLLNVVRGCGGCDDWRLVGGCSWCITRASPVLEHLSSRWSSSGVGGVDSSIIFGAQKSSPSAAASLFRSPKSTAPPPPSSKTGAGCGGGRQTTPSSSGSRPATPSLSGSMAALCSAPSRLPELTNTKENATVTVSFRPLSAREIDKGDEIASAPPPPSRSGTGDGGGRQTTPLSSGSRPATPSSSGSRAALGAVRLPVLTKAKENVTVTVRFRPLSAREIDKGDEIAWYADGDYNVRNKFNSSIAYSFDRVFGPATTTRHVYDVAAQHVVRGVIEGINGRREKGGESAVLEKQAGDHKAPGIILLAVKDVFDIIQEMPGREFLLRVSYLEIYNEIIKDLLDSMGQNLRIREDAQVVICRRQFGKEAATAVATSFIFRTYVEGIKEEIVLSAVHAFSLIASGEGSESSKAETTGLRRIEGSYINKSLLTLGTVISKLTDGKASHIPYRDSKLTRLLQPSLGGHGMVSLICTVTPASSTNEETHNTLKFAHRSKHVEIKASQNKILDEKFLVKKYQKEITSLKQEVEQLRQGIVDKSYLGTCNQEGLVNLKLQFELPGTQTMDTEVARWIIEFLVLQSIEDYVLNYLIAVLPLPKDDARLKKLLILRRISSEVSVGSISEGILDYLEMIEEIDYNEGMIIFDSMTKAYCKVATDCMVRFLRNGPNDSCACFEAVCEDWRGRFSFMNKMRDTGLVTDEMLCMMDEIEAAVSNTDVCKRLLLKVTRTRKVNENDGLENETSIALQIEERQRSLHDHLPQDSDILVGENSNSDGTNVDACKHKLPLTPKVDKVQKELKSSTAELLVSIEDPLPDALRVAATISSQMTRNETNHMHSGENHNARGSNACNPSDVGNRMKEIITENQLPRSSIELWNSSAQTHKLDECSIESSSDGLPNRLHLRTRSNRRTSPSIKNDTERGAVRRQTKRWTSFEEQKLRDAVKTYGKGNWKVILMRSNNVFGDRTTILDSSNFVRRSESNATDDRHIPVINDKKMMGMVYNGDVVRTVVSEYREELNHLNAYIQRLLSWTYNTSGSTGLDWLVIMPSFCFSRYGKIGGFGMWQW